MANITKKGLILVCGVLEMIAWRILANLDTKISLAITPNSTNMNPLVIIFAWVLNNAFMKLLGVINLNIRFDSIRFESILKSFKGASSSVWYLYAWVQRTIFSFVLNYHSLVYLKLDNLRVLGLEKNCPVLRICYKKSITVEMCQTRGICNTLSIMLIK